MGMVQRSQMGLRNTCIRMGHFIKELAVWTARSSMMRVRKVRWNLRYFGLLEATFCMLHPGVALEVGVTHACMYHCLVDMHTPRSEGASLFKTKCLNDVRVRDFVDGKLPEGNPLVQPRHLHPHPQNPGKAFISPPTPQLSLCQGHLLCFPCPVVCYIHSIHIISY